MGSGKKILVVDDEFSIVETLGELLAWEGYQVLAAANGRQALVMLAEGAPDLVLLDLMMPVMDGLQMLEAMRKSEAHAHLPVILMTAAPSRALGLLSDGAQPPWNALLRKPFELPDLLRVVKEQLDQRKPGPSGEQKAC